ncbi:24462_t:CDS:2 [Entrophospora sp. SA101]|nr:24462_t:CDS:2 [Entrophospora sp. SA101]CAJ0826915.1 3871_t:CDS:2 [Entrophospora sp. SA101]
MKYLLLKSAIYPQDFIYEKIDNPFPHYKGSLTVEVSISDVITVYFTNDNDDDPHPLKIKYLPPINITFSMTKNYPFDEILKFDLECCWLTKDSIKQLENQLEKIWQEEKDVVLFRFAEFIQNNTLDFLNISSSLVLFDEFNGFTTLKSIMSTYNQQGLYQNFTNNHFNCAICLEEKRGEQCIQLKSCQHVFCQNCICKYFEMLIKEGLITQVKCPEPGCQLKHTITIEEISGIVDKETSDRYSNLVEKQKLETDPSITYCPRKSCQAPVRKGSNDDKLCVCPKCSFAFCYWHGPSVPCTMYAVEKITNDYIQAKGQLKINLEIRYGKKNLEELVRELKTLKWVKINAQHCPGCKTIIQRSMGCEHMICLRCATHFCYLCGNAISSTAPHQHLNNKNCLQDT